MLLSRLPVDTGAAAAAEQHRGGLLQAQLGEVPLVGFFANGEIANHRLYGYTGVLTLFTGPREAD